jgi:predicted RNA-binding protein associated with RNAse of E/G family
MLRHDDAVFAVDLWLDVLVRADGVTYGVHDHDDFDAAIRRGWLSEREAEGARTGLRELVELIERRELVAFLAGVHPFDGAPAPPAPDEQRVPLSAVPLRQ